MPASKPAARRPIRARYVYPTGRIRKINESARFSGNVELRRGGLHLFADEAIYNQIDNTLDANGHIYLHKDSGETVVTPLLNYELDTERALPKTHNSHSPPVRTAVKRRIASKGAMRSPSSRCATPPVHPGQNDWYLRASELYARHKVSETGAAWNASVHFMRVPIFYSPYMTFPITDARKSGLLEASPQAGNTLTPAYS